MAAVANRWLDMLDTQGVDLTDEELIEHISEATTMSKSLEEYEGTAVRGRCWEEGGIWHLAVAHSA